MPLPEYKNGRVGSSDIYPYLKVMTERKESPYVCCGYCSAGMAVRTIKPELPNQMADVAHPIRSRGGRPHNNGSNASELRNGTKAAWNVTLVNTPKTEVDNRVREGYAAVISIDYALLPGYLKVQSNNFGHSVCLYGTKDINGTKHYGFFDPLWDQGAQGAWAKWDEIKNAMWADGNHSTTKVKLTPPPPTPPPTGGTMDSFTTPAKPSVVSVKNGGKLYDNSEFISDQQTITIEPGPRDMPLVGTVTGGYMVDYVNASGVDQNKAYWVKSGDTIGVMVLPDHVCPEPEPCPEPDYTEAKREEWDRVTSGLGIPPRP